MSGRKPYRVSEEEARRVLDEMVKDLNRDVRTAELQAQTPNENLQRIIRNWAIDPEWLESGEFISRILRLPQNWSQTCLEVINEEGQYRGQSGFRINSVRLLNFGPHPVDILTDIVRHNIYTPSGKVRRDVWDETKKYKTVQPGQVVQLPAQWSIYTLYNKSRDAWPVFGWRTWPHPVDTFREVGYEVEYSGDDGYVRLDSNTFKRDRITEALALADTRIEEQDFGSAESAIADVAHLLIDGDYDPRISDKRAEIDAARRASTTKAERPKKRGRPRKSKTETPEE